MSQRLEKQLRFYGAYHHDPTNIAIHMTCVPLILITSFLFLTNASLPTDLSTPYTPSNYGMAMALLYSLGYIFLDPLAGSILTPLLLASTVYASNLTSTYGATANTWALGIHIVSWLAQFVGHGVYEGRAPALLDNIVQAGFLAPFFVWLEGLFMLGYRPELKRRLDVAVEGDIKEFRAAKEMNSSKANGFANKGANGMNGHAKGVNGMNGHAKGVNGMNGHAKGANGMNGHAKGANGMNGHVKGANAANGFAYYINGTKMNGHTPNGSAK